MNLLENIKSKFRFKSLYDMQRVLSNEDKFIKFLEMVIWEGVPVVRLIKHLRSIYIVTECTVVRIQESILQSKQELFLIHPDALKYKKIYEPILKPDFITYL